MADKGEEKTETQHDGISKPIFDESLMCARKLNLPNFLWEPRMRWIAWMK